MSVYCREGGRKSRRRGEPGEGHFGRRIIELTKILSLKVKGLRG